MAPLQVVTTIEIQNELQSHLGHAASPDSMRNQVHGHGVNHAFDSTTGRYILVSQDTEELYPTASAEAPAELIDLSISYPDQWEWTNLAGPDQDFPLTDLPDGTRLNTRPEHARGDDWVDLQVGIRRQVEDSGLWHRLRDSLLTHDLSAMTEELNDACLDLGISPVQLLMPPIHGPRALHAAISSRSVLVDLEYFSLRERQYLPKQHDRLDYLTHAAAFVYCDVVVTERRLADLARKAKITQRFGTVVLSDIAELPSAMSTLLDN